MVPLALTSNERRLLAASIPPTAITGVTALGYAAAWCVSTSEPDDPMFVALLALIGYAPVWAATAVVVLLANRLHRPWMDTRFLPRPTLVLALAAPLVVATTTYDTLTPADPWLWASFLPLVSAVLVLAAYTSTLKRRWRRRDATRWSPRAAH